MLNAAPGLYASVNRTTSPTMRCGTWGGNSSRSAKYFVTTSSRTTPMAAPQNRRAFLACMAGLGRFARDDAHLRRLLRPILRPEHDRQHERANAHGHVGDVECRP